MPRCQSVFATYTVLDDGVYFTRLLWIRFNWSLENGPSRHYQVKPVQCRGNCQYCRTGMKQKINFFGMAFLLQKKRTEKEVRQTTTCKRVDFGPDANQSSAFVSTRVKIAAFVSSVVRWILHDSRKYCTSLQNYSFLYFFFTGFNSIENGQLTGWSIVAIVDWIWYSHCRRNWSSFFNVFLLTQNWRLWGDFQYRSGE